MKSEDKHIPKEGTLVMEGLTAHSPNGEEIDPEDLFEILCEKLNDVIPEDVIDKIKAIRPYELANMLLWKLGGRIRMHNPEINLAVECSNPNEANKLSDKIGDYDFLVIPSPYMALGLALKADANIDELVIRACDLEEYSLLAILKGHDLERMCLIDCENRKLELTMDLEMSLDVDMSGDETEQEKAMEESLKELDGFLEVLKGEIEGNPQVFNSEEEEHAIMEWCKKHGYTILAVFLSSIDRYF